MAEAKIEFKIGALSFLGEGSEKWLSEELGKLLEKVPELVKVAPEIPLEPSDNRDSTGAGQKSGGTLATYLKEKNATSNQVRKFLATAVWLHDVEKRDPLSTSDVVKALSDAKQKDLTNPSNCLNQNVKKGFCQKQGGNQFFVTDYGRNDIG